MKTFTKRICKLTATIDELIHDMEERLSYKQDAFDNASEKWQEGEKGQEAQEKLDRMQDCIDELQNALDCVSEFTEE